MISQRKDPIKMVTCLTQPNVYKSLLKRQLVFTGSSTNEQCLWPNWAPLVENIPVSFIITRTQTLWWAINGSFPYESDFFVVWSKWKRSGTCDHINQGALCSGDLTFEQIEAPKFILFKIYSWVIVEQGQCQENNHRMKGWQGHLNSLIYFEKSYITYRT